MDKLKWIALGLALIMPPGLSSESADVEAAEHASFVQAMMGQLHSLMERDYRVKFGDLRKEDPEIGQPDIRRRLQDYTREMKEAPESTSGRWREHFREYLQDKTSPLKVTIEKADLLYIFVIEGPPTPYFPQGGLQMAYRVIARFSVQGGTETREVVEVFDVISPDAEHDRSVAEGVLLRASTEDAKAAGPPAQNVYSRWEQGTLALTGEAGEAFFSALNAPAQLMPGGFRQPSPVKIVEFGPLRILCDTYPKTVCTFSWSPSPAERIAAASGDIGRGPCLKDFAVREGRVSVACGPQELVLARETAE